MGKNTAKYDAEKKTLTLVFDVSKVQDSDDYGNEYPVSFEDLEALRAHLGIVKVNTDKGVKFLGLTKNGKPCFGKGYKAVWEKANAPAASEDLLDEDTIAEEPKVTRKAFVTIDGAKKEIPAFNYGGTFPSPATIADMVDTRGEDEDAAKFTSALVKHIKAHAKVEKVTTDIAKSYKFKQGRPPKA